MSLYNMMFGVNPMAGLLLTTLNLRLEQIPRFRDCFLSSGEKPQIVIYTRTGGGNREYYEKPGGEYADEYSGPYNEDLRKVDGFVKDEDDSFDTTYALFYYNFPEHLHEPFKNIANALQIDNRNPAERFKELLDDLKSGKHTPRTEEAIKVGERIVSQIEALMNKGK